MNSITDRLDDAEDWSDIVSILDDSTVDDVPALRPRLPDLANHTSFVVRASALDLIGEYDLMDMVEVVRKKLADPNAIVRSYALGAYYDLRGSESLGTLKRLLKDKALKVRLAAMCHLFVATGEKEFLDRIRRVVTRKNCNYHHQYAVLHNMRQYLELEHYPEVLSLMRAVRATVDSDMGIAQDLDELLQGLKKNT